MDTSTFVASKKRKEVFEIFAGTVCERDQIAKQHREKEAAVAIESL